MMKFFRLKPKPKIDEQLELFTVANRHKATPSSASLTDFVEPDETWPPVADGDGTAKQDAEASENLPPGSLP